MQGTALVRLGRFEMRAILGRGSMGTVFKAWDTKLERWVAIKTVRAGAGMAEWDGDVVRGLVSEAAMVARFNHPHVVAVHDVYDATDAAYIVMEFVDGLSLEDLLRRVAPARPRARCRCSSALASALAAAHAVERAPPRRQARQRAARPRRRDPADRLRDRVVRVRAAWAADLFGTPGYMPPETLRGQGFDQSGDLFALGAVAYRCLTGAPAFGGRTTADVLTNTHQGPGAAAARSSAAMRPVELETLVMALLEADPARRLADAALVARDLGAMAAAHGWPWVPPAAGPGLCGRPRPRHRAARRTRRCWTRSTRAERGARTEALYSSAAARTACAQVACHAAIRMTMTWLVLTSSPPIGLGPPNGAGGAIA